MSVILVGRRTNGDEYLGPYFTGLKAFSLDAAGAEEAVPLALT